MSNSPASSASPHPIIWIAGIAVTLFSLLGIASLTGMLPRSSADSAPPVATANTPASATQVATPPATPAAAPETTAPAKTGSSEPAPVAHHKPATKHKLAALPPAAGTGVPPDYVAPSAAPSAPACANCGVIADIREVKHEGQASGLGAIGGGIVGGALANNVGQGNGRTLATIAGMVGGGMLGNKIEKSQRATLSYEVSVKMDDGTNQMVSYEKSPSWRVGDPVKLVNGTLVAR